MSDQEQLSYHGQPILKQPVWSWEIPCYFFTGGAAGSSAVLAYLSGLRGNEVLARRAWATALAGLGVSPVLLISDLGRPARFLNMLRMFKVTSPMSVGSWILSASGATTAVAAANAWFGVFEGPARLARPAAALFGLPLSTYTAALVADTAVPAWHEAREALPFVFASGAALSAGAAAVLATPPGDAAAARRLAIAGTVVELATKELMERRLDEQGEPYRRGRAGMIGRVSQACLAAGSALLLARGARSRAAAAGAGALMLAGALAARWNVFEAGTQSASDPRYVVSLQRQRIEAGARTAGRQAPASRRRSRGGVTG